MVMQNRNLLIDRLKGFGIILVVIGHLIQMKIDPVGFDKNLVFRLIYSFHMALFFILSGQVYRVRPLKEEITLSFKRLLIPFLVFYFIVSCNFNIGHFVSTVWIYFENPGLGFWFFFVLALIRIFSSVVINQKTPSYFFLSLTFLFIISFSSRKYFAMHLVLYYAPFFIIGYLIQKLNWVSTMFERCINKKTKGYFLFLIVLLTYLLVFPYFHRNIDELSMFEFLFQKTLLGILGSLVAYLFFYTFRFGVIDKWLEIAGRHSLYIYGLHLLFLPLYTNIGTLAIVPMVLMPIIVGKVYEAAVVLSKQWIRIK